MGSASGRACSYFQHKATRTGAHRRLACGYPGAKPDRDRVSIRPPPREKPVFRANIKRV